jgi:hypothetical protein
MSEETKDKIAEWVLYIFFGGLALFLIGMIIYGLFVSPLGVLILVGFCGVVWLIGWASHRMTN